MSLGSTSTANLSHGDEVKSGGSRRSAMKASVSRRSFMKASGAAAAGALAAAPSGLAALQAQAPRAGRPQDELTAGMIDFHVHTSPDTAERTVNAVEAARTARDRGLRAIVLKGTAFETVTRASQAMAE